VGGLVGAADIFIDAIIERSKIGALALVEILLAGQLIASVVIGHFECLRLVGVLLLVGEFLLIRRN
jgi:uncharacterized membrane protein YdcZ (DUF606 family)